MDTSADQSRLRRNLSVGHAGSAEPGSSWPVQVLVVHGGTSQWVSSRTLITIHLGEGNRRRFVGRSLEQLDLV